MESRTDSERKSTHSRGIKNRHRIWERKSMHLHGIKNRLRKTNLCIHMASRTDSERKSMHTHGIKNRLRKSMHLHRIKNRLRKKIHAFTLNQEQNQEENPCICTMHLSSGSAGCQFIALTFKIGLTTRSLNFRETVMSSDSSSSEKTEREKKKKSYKW